LLELEKALGRVQTSEQTQEAQKSKDKVLVDELLSVAMRGRGLKGVLDSFSTSVDEHILRCGGVN